MSTNTAIQKHDSKLNVTTLDDVDDSLLDAMTKNQGKGNATKEDFALPFLRLLQSLSPALSRSDPAYVEGAKAGDLLNSVTGEVFDGREGVRVVHCFFEKRYIEWRKRSNKGGFVASYATKQDATEQADPENDVIDTRNHYVLAQGRDGSWTPALLSLKATGNRMSKDWMAKMAALVHPKTGEAVDGAVKVSRIRTTEKQNDKGRFFVPLVELEAGYTPAAVMRQAFLFQNQMLAMSVADRGKVAEKAAEADYEIEDAPERADQPKF